MNTCYAVIVLFLFVCVFSSPVSAKNLIGNRNFLNCPIIFDPRDYLGTYHVDNQPTGLTGVQKLQLSVTDADKYHTLEIGGQGYPFNQILFSVTANCKVIGQNRNSVVYSDNFVTFKNVSIEIDPGDFGGIYFIKGMTKGFRSNTSLTVVPTQNSFVSVYARGKGTEIYFSIGERGDLTLFSLSSESAKADGNRLIFWTKRYSVDPGSFTGTYQIGDITSNIGKQTELVGVTGLNIPISIVPDKDIRPIPKNICVEVGGTCLNPNSFELLDSANKKFNFSMSVVPEPQPFVRKP